MIKRHDNGKRATTSNQVNKWTVWIWKKNTYERWGAMCKRCLRSLRASDTNANWDMSKFKNAFSRYRTPPWMSLLLRELVPGNVTHWVHVIALFVYWSWWTHQLQNHLSPREPQWGHEWQHPVQCRFRLLYNTTCWKLQTQNSQQLTRPRWREHHNASVWRFRSFSFSEVKAHWK